MDYQDFTTKEINKLNTSLTNAFNKSNLKLQNRLMDSIQESASTIRDELQEQEKKIQNIELTKNEAFQKIEAVRDSFQNANSQNEKDNELRFKLIDEQIQTLEAKLRALSESREELNIKNEVRVSPLSRYRSSVK